MKCEMNIQLLTTEFLWPRSATAVCHHFIPYISHTLPRMSQPGVTGVLCADEQGLALSGTTPSHSTPLSHPHSFHNHTPSHPHCSQTFPLTPSHPHTLPPSPAQGTLKSHAAGLVSAVAEKACQLRHGTEPDEKPVVVMEFDTGSVRPHPHVSL